MRELGVGVVVAMLLVGGPGDLLARAGATEPRPDDLDVIVRHVSGGGYPASGDLHRVWAPIMAASALERMHTYVAPAAVAGYAGGGVPDSACAVATNARYWRQNARYCAADSTILYDEAWFQELDGLFGPFAPAAVLAHEWGHHVQEFAGPVPPGVRAELQADCFAGMYLGETEGLDPDGTFTIRLDELRTSLTWFFEHGDRDYRQSQWFQPDVHGSRQQRIVAFTTGYIAKSPDRGAIRGVVNGLDWCLGYTDFEPGVFEDIGPFRLLGIPGRPGMWDDDAYLIRTRPRPAFPSSAIRLRWFPASETVEEATQEWLVDLLATWLPGASIEPLGALAVRTGSGVTSVFERQDEAGIVALAVPVTGEGGLLIVASRPRPVAVPQDAAEDLATFLEQAIAINQVVTRLCSPGESPEPTVDTHNAVCTVDAQ